MAQEPDAQDMAGPPLVSGEVIIAESSPAFADASLHISLDDVSYADAPATTVAETVIRQPSQPDRRGGTGSTVLAFALPALPGTQVIDSRRHYAVRVWLDRDGDGRAGPGDLYSDQRYPVLTRGHGDTVTITLGPG
jgi:uncharacterized lipoprotein YbaY